jgi:excisionase family DNA binding protein
MEKLWTTSEVAEFLGVEETDVEQLVKDGKLTGYRLGGQFLRFKPDQVKGLKAQGGVATAAKGGAGRAASEGLADQLRDAWYFHEFYVVSFVLLAVLVIYIIQ